MHRRIWVMAALSEWPAKIIAYRRMTTLNAAIRDTQHRRSYSRTAHIRMMGRCSPNRGTVRNGTRFYLTMVSWLAVWLLIESLLIRWFVVDTSDSIHLSKCRPALCNSEDDTIMEEPTFTTNNHKEQPNHQQQPQKVATILRTRSCRDREVLCKYNRDLSLFVLPYFCPALRGWAVTRFALTCTRPLSNSMNFRLLLSCIPTCSKPGPSIENYVASSDKILFTENFTWKSQNRPRNLIINPHAINSDERNRKSATEVAPAYQSNKIIEKKFILSVRLYQSVNWI